MLIKIKRRVLRSAIMIIGSSRSQFERRYSGFAIGLLRWHATEKSTNLACIILAYGRKSDRILRFLFKMTAGPLLRRIFDGSMHFCLINASHRVNAISLL